MEIGGGRCTSKEAKVEGMLNTQRLAVLLGQREERVENFGKLVGLKHLVPGKVPCESPARSSRCLDKCKAAIKITLSNLD